MLREISVLGVGVAFIAGVVLGLVVGVGGSALSFGWTKGRDSRFPKSRLSAEGPGRDRWLLGPLRARQGIDDAIRPYHEAHRVGLAEAKDAVERLAPPLPLN